MDFGKRRAFVHALLLMGAALAAACSGPTPATPPPAGGDAGPVQPKVNRLVMAVNAPAMENNDPRGDRGPTNWVWRPMYEYLVGVDPATGKYIPQLATDWKLQPDGKSFLFTLREGVKFHGGRGEFGPDAFIDTFKLETRDASPLGVSPSGNIYGLLNPLIAGIDKVAPNQVLMRLKTTDGTFMLTISEQRGVFYMLNAKHFEELGQPNWQTGPVAGTGPYQFKAREQGQFMRYERAPYKHWRVTPDFPEFEFRYMKEASTRIASLLAGEVQMADLPEDQKAQAQKQGFKLLAGKVPGSRAFMKFYCCHMNNPKDLDSGWMHPESPLTDVRVRKALTKAIDLAQINKAFFGGKGEIMYNAHLHPTRAGWDPSWVTRYKDEYGYDPEAAKRLLADAGYSPAKVLETNILFPSDATGYSGADDIMESVAGMWRSIGVKVNFAQIDPVRQREQTNQFQLFNHSLLGGTGSDTWTGVTTYGSTLGTGIGSGIQMPDLDRVLAKLQTTLDEAEQDKLWRQAGEVTFVQHREVPLFWIPVETTVSPTVVAGYDFPGSITGAWTHVFNIKAAR